MKKTPFLAQLREIACETAERELRRAGRSAQGCPYLEEILGRFARRAPDQLERSIRRYAPEARTATRARDYLPPVATRLGQGIATWVRTGRMPDNLPDEFRPGRLSDFLEVGASLGRAARALFKGKSGAAGRGNIDASALAGQLGPGRPLDGSARTRMESAFGHPFGDVRVHADDRAAALSRELEARAFTLGSHVAFGAGEFHPGTPVGDALLAHELAHVVQQRGAAPSTGLPAGNASDTLERDADHAAVGAVGFLARLARGVRGARSPQGPRQRGGLRLSRCPRSAPKTPEAGPAMYDTTQHTIIRLPDGRTVAAMEDNLRYERANGNITSWKAEDVFPGSNEQLYILYAIWQLSHTKSWDREVDLITEIGPSQRGAITVRIDARGNAVGTLISDREPKVAATYKTFDEAVKGLKAKYKLSDIRDENKVWSDDDPAKAVEKRKKAVDELNKVAAAWSKLSPAEAAALEGYALIRTDTLTGPDGKPAAGLTTTGDVIAPDRLSSTRQREIRFADLAFAGDAVSFVGDTENAAPASADTILHEAGHAQERKAKVDAESAHVEAEMATNVADKQYSDQHQKASDTMTAAEASVSKLNRTKRAASKGYVDAFRAAFDAIDAPTAEQDPTKVAALLQAADAAVQARNTARDALKDGPAVAAYATALTEQDALLAAVKALMAARQTVDTAEASQTAARDPTGTQSARVQRFVDFVNTKGIKPFTDYAKRNWPAHPGEFYAEAFALWHADPKFLASSFPELKKWFDAGEHLKWSARSSSRWLRGAQGPPRRRP
ncbi:MAG TPA: DUF4157 domain-containing protein [Kofleriaceae bacterium]|nr:DUF4157 domain-containing protein [Kofleriaceae bacterium]